MNLLLVESPTKSRTIKKFLGPEYEVLASFGHIRDLPKSKLGVDIEHGFQPSYVVPLKAKKVLAELKSAASKAKRVILSTDEDREGEAIAWHLAESLDLDPSKTERIVFHEITKHAIDMALKNPRHIDMHLVNAQQGRRVLDRLVGYELSPFLWKKVAQGLSAGRVQSVAVRLIVDREREIESFTVEEYWTVAALLQTPRKESFEAVLHAKKGETIEKLAIKNQKEAEEVVASLSNASWRVQDIAKKDARRLPSPPFTTSALVQEASRRLHFSSKMTMRLAQMLYERGRISYHRTDAVTLSNLFLSDARAFITGAYGKDYYQARTYKAKSRLAQEAHEAIRPTDVTKQNLAGEGDASLTKLYDLIWRRAVASQMKDAFFEATTADIAAGADKSKAAPDYTFRATGSIMRFDGFLKVWPAKVGETLLPELLENDPLILLELVPTQHFTEPPPRYTEATLVKTLEAHDIGRPSTYVPIISTIQDRRYVEKERGSFRPSDLGKTVTDLMKGHFPEIVDVGFTATMETNLDRVAQGKSEWVPVIQAFYRPFKETLMKKYEEVSRRDITTEATGETCPECGKPLVIRLGRFGKFYGCSGFPVCTYKRSMGNGTAPDNGAVVSMTPEKTDESCPKCGQPLVIRSGRFGKFYGCSMYPKCAYTRNVAAPSGIKCPKCGEGDVVEKQARTKKGRRTFWGCSCYPECKYATWQKPGSEQNGKQLAGARPKTKRMNKKSRAKH